MESISQRILQAHLKTPPVSAQPKFLKELPKPTKKEFRFFFSNAFKKLKHPTLKPTKKQNDNDCKATGGQEFKHYYERNASSQHWLYNMAVCVRKKPPKNRY